MKKADRQILEAYLRSNNYTLDQVYGRCSTAKRHAYAHCIALANEYTGWALRIIGYNTFVFTAGFICRLDDGKKYLCYITPSCERFIKIDEEV